MESLPFSLKSGGLRRGPGVEVNSEKRLERWSFCPGSAICHLFPVISNRRVLRIFCGYFWILLVDLVDLAQWGNQWNSIVNSRLILTPLEQLFLRWAERVSWETGRIAVATTQGRRKTAQRNVQNPSPIANEAVKDENASVAERCCSGRLVFSCFLPMSFTMLDRCT